MKKKIFCLLLLLIMPIILLFGCASDNAQTSEIGKEYIVGNVILVKVEKGEDFDLFVDKNTKVIYIYNKTSYQGGLTAMLNADGTPMLWEGELKGE